MRTRRPVVVLKLSMMVEVEQMALNRALRQVDSIRAWAIRGYGNAGGNYNKNSYKGNISSSGLREGAKKTTLDIKSMVNNFESGEGVAKLSRAREKPTKHGEEPIFH